MKKIKLILLITVIWIFTTHAFTRDSLECVEFAAFFSFHLIPQRGSLNDYNPIDNEFCISNAYQVSDFGLSLSFLSKKGFFMGLESSLTLQSKTKMTNPKVGDYVQVNARRGLFGFLTLGKQIMSTGKIMVFGQVGTGIHYQLDNQVEYYVSTQENILKVGSRGRPFGWAFFLGVKNFWYLSQDISLLLDFRYVYIYRKDPESAIILRFGVNFRFHVHH